MAGPDTAGAWLAGRRLVAIDGTCLDVADTPANDEHFGRPGVNKGERAAFPQARVVALAECGTHAMFAAAAGVYRDAEATLAETLLAHLDTGMLLLADRGFFSYTLLRKASQTGADLLWRVRTGYRAPAPAHVADLPDGSWLADLRASTDTSSDPMRARVIDYTVADGRENPTVYRLLTTMLDPEQAPAAELAAAYAQRWEIESVFDELKTHQRGPRVVLRSKSPDLVLQEIWGHLCCHYAIRNLMTQAAHHGGHDPDRVSFTATLRIVCQSVAQQGAFPPWSPRRRPRPLAGRPAPHPRPPQPPPPTTISTPRHQTQNVQMARQTRRPRPLALTRAHTQLYDPTTLTEQYCCATT